MLLSSKSALTTCTRVILLVSVFLTTSFSQDVGYRLPMVVKPISYVLNIRPNYTSNILDVSDFDGDVEIVALANNDTQSIVLHAGNNITIASVVVTNINGSSNYDVQIQGYNSTTEKLTLTTSKTIKSNEMILITFAFNGLLADNFLGFYKSTYNITNSTGDEEVRMMLTTQLGLTHARKVFPCFDEPKFKATFQVTVTVPPGYSALSNTKIHPNSTDTEITFEQTVKMSTYLVDFMVYERATYGSTNVVFGSDNVTFTTWGREEAIRNHIADYSQTITYKILAGLEEYTNIPYASNGIMTKLDLAGIPQLFYTAMENWGLVTFIEGELFFNEANDTEDVRENVATTISHELTHQWFGNLVTLDWWSFTWLNEGFAEYFQYYNLESIYPEWRIMDRLIMIEQIPGLFDEASGSGWTLTQEVNSPSDVDQQFSSIAYSKGACIVRALSIALGKENFQAGLQKYLQERAYKTANPEQLFQYLCAEYNETQNKFECDDLMGWFTTPGYPVINFLRDNSNTTFTISQAQYFTDANRTSDSIYPVYLEWFTSEGAKNQFWLLSKEDSSSDALPTTEDGWYLVKSTGYFRVNYDRQNWKNLHLYLSQQDLNRISPLDRATMVDNVFNFARFNYLDYKTALIFMRYMVCEVDYLPWAAADYSGLGFLHRLFVNADESGNFLEYVRTLVENVYNYLGFQDDGGHIDKLHRSNILYWACLVDASDCRKSAADMLVDSLDNVLSVPVNLRDAVYCYGIMGGTADTWERMWQILEDTTDTRLQGLLLNALGCSAENSTLITYLERSVSGGVQVQNLFTVFSSAYTNSYGVDVVLDYLVANFSHFRNKSDDSTITQVVSGIARYLTREDQREKMTSVLQSNSPLLDSIFNSTLAIIDVNLDWLKRNGEEILSTIESILLSEKLNQTLW